MLSVSNLRKVYHKQGSWSKSSPKVAVRNVSFEVAEGETVGLVGESGSGKTTIGRCLVRTLQADGGDMLFAGTSIGSAKGHELRALRRQMQMVFQDPFSSLNPRLSMGAMLEEVLRCHNVVDEGDIAAEVKRLLEMVGLSPMVASRYPHELSGGQRQRVGIARSLAVRPSFLICDEPVSALDVSVQAQILNLLRSLQSEFKLTYLFIAHDLAVVRQMATRVVVMLHGDIVESGPSGEIFENPQHPYTRFLLASIPGTGPSRTVVSRPSPDPERACVFYDRCPKAESRCATEKPILEARSRHHDVRCHLV